MSVGFFFSLARPSCSRSRAMSLRVVLSIAEM